jgi:hypoxanthine-DNA glycosylase
MTDAVLHAFAPIGSARAQLLVLGSMPGVASLTENQYYAHGRNAFWPVMQALFGGSTDTYDNKCQILHENHIAVWDVLTQCVRPGSLDSNIRKDSVVCNDFAAFFKAQPDIRTVAFNGKAAEQLFRKHVLPDLADKPSSGVSHLNLNAREIELVTLPSSSPAMASLNLSEKIVAWRKALRHDAEKGDSADNRV